MSTTEHMHDLPVEEEADVEVEEKEDEQIASEQEEEGSSQEDSADAAEEYSDSVQKRINKLTGRLRESERREQAALQYAQGLKAQYDTVEKRAQQSDEGFINEYDNRLKVSEESLNDQLKRAIEMGDVDSQVDAQKKLSEHAFESKRLEYARQQMAQQTAQQQAAQQAAQQPAQQQQAAAREPSPKAEQWSSKNEWFGTDEPMTLTAFSIHKSLVETEGFDPESDNYYAEIDRRMRDNFPHRFTEADQGGAQPRRSNVASTGRAASGARKSGKKSVKLTPSQVAIAKKLGVSLEDYAKQVSLLETRSQ